MNFDQESYFMKKLKQQNEYIVNNDKSYRKKIIEQIVFLRSKIVNNKEAVNHYLDSLKLEHDLFYNVCDDITCCKYLKFYKMSEINEVFKTDFNYDTGEDIISLQQKLYLLKNLNEFLCYHINIRNEILDFIYGLEYIYENKFIDSDNFYAYISELEKRIRHVLKIDEYINMEFINGRLCYSDPIYHKTKPLIYLIPPTDKYLHFVKHLKNDFCRRFLSI